MNAAPVPRPLQRSDYEAIVRAMKPLCHGEELELRSSLLLMRDRASATKAIACEPSWMLLDVVERAVSEHALNPRVPLGDIRELRRLCINVIASASSFNTFYQPSLPGVEQGEANGGA